MKSVFLSHSHEDKDFVRTLHEMLKENGVKSWIDEAEIKLGDSLLNKITEGIKKADYVAIVLSQSSIKSPWVEKELEMAMNQEVNSGKVKVLPIIIEDCDIPEFIQIKKYGDFRNPKSSIKAMNELLSLLSEGKTLNENSSILQKKNTKEEHQRFLKIFDYLSKGNRVHPPRFNNHVSEKIAEVFCLEENYSKFEEFINIFDDLATGSIVSPPRMGKRAALEMALRRIKVNMDLDSFYIG